MAKPFIPPMKGNKVTPFQPNQPKPLQKPNVNVPKPLSRRPSGRGG